MTTPTVDLTRLNPISEIVLRAGDVNATNARERMQEAYTRLDLAYPDAIGLSVLFRSGATLDELAQEGNFPHPKLSHATIGRLMSELATVGYRPILYATPTPDLPDHHSLAMAELVSGAVESTLPDAVAEALIRAMTVSDNPHRRQRQP